MSRDGLVDPSKLLMDATAANAPWLEQLAAYGPSASVIGLLTEWEAQWRGAVDRQQAAWLRSFGVASRRDLERARERLAAEQAGARCDRRAEISWHEGGEGPALLLLNGWTASGLAWPAAWVAELEQSHRVIRPDNRGSGWSRHARTPFTIGHLADDAADVLAASGARSATVLGLSMGGMVAQELALRRPELVDALILVGSQPPAPRRIPSPPPMVQRVMQAPGDADLRAHIARVWGDVCAPAFAASHADLLDELAEQVVRRPTPRALLLLQLRAISGWSGAARLAAITAPTTVVHGLVDPLMPVGNGMRLAQLIPGARYVELSGVGHLVAHEDPDTLTAIIREGAP